MDEENGRGYPYHPIDALPRSEYITEFAKALQWHYGLQMSTARNAAILASYLRQAAREDGVTWVARNYEETAEDTTLTTMECKWSRRLLSLSGVMESMLRDFPARSYMRIYDDAIADLIAMYRRGERALPIPFYEDELEAEEDAQLEDAHRRTETAL